MSKEMLEERKKSLKHGFEKMIEYVEGVKYLNKIRIIFIYYKI